MNTLHDLDTAHNVKHHYFSWTPVIITGIIAVLILCSFMSCCWTSALIGSSNSTTQTNTTPVIKDM